MTEHVGADPVLPADAAPRRGTFLPAAAPVTPRSIDEAGDLLMPIYAEPVVRRGATRAPGALPSAALLTLDIDGERTAASRLRRGGQVATAGMAAAVIAVVVSAFAPLPDGGAGSAYDSSALADTFPQPFPTQESQPLAAEGGRVSIDLRKADDPAVRQDEAPNLFGIPLPSLPPFLQDVIQATAPAAGGSGPSGPGEQPGAAAPSVPSGPESPVPPATGDPSTSPSPSGGATAPGGTPTAPSGDGSGTPAGGVGSPTAPGGEGAPTGPTAPGGGSPTDPSPTRPSPTDPTPGDPTPTVPATPTAPGTPTHPSAPSQPTAPGAPTQPQPSAPGEPTQPGPTQPAPTQPEPTQPEPTQPEPTQPEPTQPEPTQPEPSLPPVTTPPPVSPPPATGPPVTPPPATTAPLAVDTSCRVTGSLLGLVTSNECTVRLTGEPNAHVDIFYGGLWWRDVHLDASGQAAPVARSADVLGLLGLLDDLLIGGEFTASYR
jgi:hypothetical protein